MRKRLSELEQKLMRLLWARPDSTVTACRDALAKSAKPLRETTVRTLLQRLEKKGYVTHSADGRTYLYKAATPKKTVAAEAVRQIIDRFCEGSLEELLVGMVENEIVDQKELEALARKIAAKRQKKP